MNQNSSTSLIPDRGVRQATLVWSMITVVLFLLPVAFGLIMRLMQGNLVPDTNHQFYEYLTAHGLLMVGIWFTAALVLLTNELTKYTKPSTTLLVVSLVITVVGTLMVLWAVFIGGMATSWYFLYPLPLRVGTEAGRTVFLLALGVLGVGWLVGCFNVMLAIGKKYSLSEALGWHLISRTPGPEVPMLVLIATVSLIGVIVCLLMAVILLLLYFVEIAGSVPNDALLMKNLTFVFGHTIANMNLYLVIAVLYERFPRYGGGEFKNSRMLALVWNSVLAIVMFAYFHHLYLDFVQPSAVQYVGQFASYGAGVAAATFTIYSVLAFVNTHRMNWNFSSLLLFVSTAMWTIGGVAALIDATIPVNFKMHNTLWVPAHFHTYYFTGAATMLLAFMWTLACEASGSVERPWIKNVLLPMLLLGGSGFLVMFYLGGASSIPRKYAAYPAELSVGTTYARLSVAFISVFIVSYIVFSAVLLKKLYAGLRR